MCLEQPKEGHHRQCERLFTLAPNQFLVLVWVQQCNRNGGTTRTGTSGLLRTPGGTEISETFFAPASNVSLPAACYCTLQKEAA